jgi:hypothetical protein
VRAEVRKDTMGGTKTLQIRKVRRSDVLNIVRFAVLDCEMTGSYQTD